MKSINDIEHTESDKLNRALLKSYIEALKDDSFKSLVTKLKITEEVAMKYTSKLGNTVSELKNCKNCKCLGECKNKVNGCVSYPRIEDNRLRFDYVACKYKREALEEEKYSSNSFSEPLMIKNARMKDIDLTDKKRKDLIKQVKDFYKSYKEGNKPKGFYLHGSFGSGKSYILAALLNELARLGATSTIIYYPEMLRTLKESFSDDFDSKMHLLKTSDLLLIDDIGAESVTPWSRDEILGTILQYRMDSNLPTFFTSNLNIEELETHLSQTKNNIDIVKSKRIIERIKQLTIDIELISENRRK